MKVEGHDQYQELMDGSRRLTRRNRKYLKLFTPFQAGKSGPTYKEPEYQTESAGNKGTQVGLSDHQGGVVGREPGHPGVAPARGAGQKQQHEEGRYQPVPPGPLVKAAPECVEPAAQGAAYQDVVQEPAVKLLAAVQVATPARRSTRTGRGTTTKYQDYVQCLSCRNTGEQSWPALEEDEGHKW